MSKITTDRRGFIGGSDISAIIGVSPWKSAHGLALEKRGDIDQPEGETSIQRRGRILEPAIAQLYAEEHGVELTEGVTLPHPGAPHYRAQIDAIEVVEGVGIPIEVKSASEFTRGKWGPSGTDDAPTYYCAQLHWQLIASGAPYGRIVALLGADDLRVYTIERDDAVNAFLIEKANVFWSTLQAGLLPDIDFDHPTATATLEKLFKNFDATEILQADDALRSWRDVYLEASEEVKRYEAVKDGAKAHLLAAMRNAAIIDFGDGTMFERKRVKRAAYSCQASEYVTGSMKKMPKAKGPAALPERIEA